MKPALILGSDRWVDTGAPMAWVEDAAESGAGLLLTQRGGWRTPGGEALFAFPREAPPRAWRAAGDQLLTFHAPHRVYPEPPGHDRAPVVRWWSLDGALRRSLRLAALEPKGDDELDRAAVAPGWAAASDRGQRVRLIDLRDGSQAGGFQAVEGWTVNLGFTSKGRLFACNQDRAWLYAPGSRALIAEWGIPDRFEIDVMAVGPGDLVAVGEWRMSRGGCVCVRDLRTGEERLRVPHRARGLCFSPDGERLALVGDDERLRLWHLGRGEEIFAAPIRYGPRVVVFSPDGQRLVLAGGQTLRFLSAVDGQTIWSSTGHRDRVRRMVFVGDRLLSATAAGEGLSWRLPTGAVGRAWTETAFLSVAGDRVATAASTQRCRIRTPGGQVVTELPGETGCALALSPDGRRLASAGWNMFGDRPTMDPDLRIRIWDVASRTLRHTFEGVEPYQSAAWSPDGASLALTTWRALELLDPETGDERWSWQGDEPRHPRFAADGSLVWALWWSIWIRPPGGEARPLVEKVEGAVHDIAIRGQELIVGTRAGPVLCYALPTGEARPALSKAIAGPTAVACSSDGRWIAAAGGDTRIRVWDLERDQTGSGAGSDSR